MTRPDAQAPQPAPSATEVEYVRKLSLAILSTLQAKGLLSADEVDAILIAARRAAQGVPATPAAAPRAEVAPAMQVTVQPAPSLTFHAHARAPQTADATGESPEATADHPASAQAASPEAEALVAAPLTVEAPSQPIELGPDVVEDPATPPSPPTTVAQDTPPASEDGPVTTDVPAEELDIEPPAQPIVIGPDAVEDGTASPVSLDTETQDAPGVPDAAVPQGLLEDSPALPEMPEVEPPAQTIVIGPDEVEEGTVPEAGNAAADDLVLDGATLAKPAEDSKPAVPTFDLKLD